MFIVEANVPITDGRGVGKSPGRPAKYPWKDMEIGDSFKADVPPEVLRAAAFKYGHNHHKRFTVRIDGDGSRAWRIA